MIKDFINLGAGIDFNVVVIYEVVRVFVFFIYRVVNSTLRSRVYTSIAKSWWELTSKNLVLSFFIPPRVNLLLVLYVTVRFVVI